MAAMQLRLERISPAVAGGIVARRRPEFDAPRSTKMMFCGA
jgi:hypothetical protein